MFDKIYQATHPDMMGGASNDDLCDRDLVGGLFSVDEIRVNDSHSKRMVIGGAAPVGAAIALSLQDSPVAGVLFLERRELGVVNDSGWLAR